jgi:hypothetical protein
VVKSSTPSHHKIFSPLNDLQTGRRKLINDLEIKKNMIVMPQKVMKSHEKRLCGKKFNAN